MRDVNVYSNRSFATPMDFNKKFEVTQPPDDTVSTLEFSPAALQQTFLIAGSWDNSVRCWEVEQSGKTVLKSTQSMSLSVLDTCWNDDGTKAFMASSDKQVKCWDLGTNQTISVGSHDAPVQTCHWIKAPSYNCLMTGSWDKTLKFWDVRSSNPMMIINLPKRVFCADVDYPMAVIGTASRGIAVYNLEGKPELMKIIDTPLKHQHRCVSIFRDKKKQSPIGFCLGSVDSRVAIHYLQPQSSKDNFTFKCHQSCTAMNDQDIFAVNDIKFHPVHGTLATVGSDGTYAFWNIHAQTKLKSSKLLDLPITKCCFNSNGRMFAYGTGYDWFKGHEYYDPSLKPQIFIKSCNEDLKLQNSL